MTTNFTPNYPSFFCSICSFKTSNKKDYSRHILTAKHKNATNTTEILQKTPQNTPFFICNCGKEYKHNSSLWNHKKKCSTKKHEPNITDISRNPMNVEIIMELLQQNISQSAVFFIGSNADVDPQMRVHILSFQSTIVKYHMVAYLSASTIPVGN